MAGWAAQSSLQRAHRSGIAGCWFLGHLGGCLQIDCYFAGVASPLLGLQRAHHLELYWWHQTSCCPVVVSYWSSSQKALHLGLKHQIDYSAAERTLLYSRRDFQLVWIVGVSRKVRQTWEAEPHCRYNLSVCKQGHGCICTYGVVLAALVLILRPPGPRLPNILPVRNAADGMLLRPHVRASNYEMLIDISSVSLNQVL